jgi:hypothetical protein
MKYFMFIKGKEMDRREPMPPALDEAMDKFVTESFKSGVLKSTGGLKPTKESFRIRSKGGKLHFTDGPFTEAKEVVGGYALVEVNTDAEARGLARQFMELHRIHWPSFEAECEVRPLEEFPEPS